MKNRNLWGIILLILGAIMLMNAFNVFPQDIDVFFPGWWTLFLIVPAGVSMSRTGITAGNAVLMILGVGFLLQAQGWNLK
ncbi:MAG TPA: DUF5668 domain-containing protein, partial [Bacillota bacterium]|nr:DUF5668 domain-containing protein [Bacillota bacterium]